MRPDESDQPPPLQATSWTVGLREMQARRLPPAFWIVRVLYGDTVIGSGTYVRYGKTGRGRPIVLIYELGASSF